MDPLAVNAIAPVTLSALSALRPVQAVANPASQTGEAALSLQSLAQGLFQRALQVSAVFPVAEPLPGGLTLAQEATASLLAALNPPQAAAPATPAANASTTPAAIPTANPPTRPPAPPTTPSTAPTASSSVTVLGDLPAAPDTFTAGSSLEFALQTALRFGAGVGAPAAPAQANPGLGAGLVRDAVAVTRIGNLQSHAGGPGPEAFTHPQATVLRALHGYQANPVVQGLGQVDLLA